MVMKYKKGVTQPATEISVGHNSGKRNCSGAMVIQPKGWSIEMALGKPPIFWKTNHGYKMTGHLLIRTDLCN